MEKTRQHRRLARADPTREPHPNINAVLDVIQRFEDSKAIPLGETPARANGRCHEVSNALFWFSLGQDLDAQMLSVFRLRLPPTVPGFKKGQMRSAAHWLVWYPTDKIGVDYTARQFWLGKPHPWIVTLAELKLHWKTVEL